MKRATRRLLGAAGIVAYPRPPEGMHDVWWTGRHTWEGSERRVFGTLLSAPFPLQLRANCGLHALPASDAWLLEAAGRAGEILLLEGEGADWRPKAQAPHNAQGLAIEYALRSNIRWLRAGMQHLISSGALTPEGHWNERRILTLRRRLGSPPARSCRSYEEIVW